MNLLRLILFLFIPGLLGWGILRPLIGQKEKSDFSKLMILSFGLGTGILTFLMFFWGFLNLPIKYFIIFISILAGLILIFYPIRSRPARGTTTAALGRPASNGVNLFLNKRWKMPKIKMRRLNLNWLEVILILIILFQVFYVFSTSMMRPIINFDAVANYGLKAKMIFYENKNFFNLDSNVFLGGDSHINYPLHVPLLMAWIYFGMGQVNDVLVNIIFAFYFLALIGFVYLSLKEEISRQNSLIFTMFLSTLPLLVYHGFNAYCDLPLAFYFTVAAISLFKYFKNKNKTDLIMAGIFAGLITWIKNEGLILVGILLIVFTIYLILEKITKSKIKSFLLFIFCFLIFFLPWFIFKRIFGFGYSNLSPDAVFLNGFHPEIFSKLLEQLFIFHSFHIWPGIFLIILILNWRRVFGKPNIYLFLIIFGALAGFLFVYLFTSAYQFVVDSTASSRNLLIIMPLTVFLAGLLYKGGKEEENLL